MEVSEVRGKAGGLNTFTTVSFVQTACTVCVAYLVGTVHCI